MDEQILQLRNYFYTGNYEKAIELGKSIGSGESLLYCIRSLLLTKNVSEAMDIIASTGMNGQNIHALIGYISGEANEQ